MITALSLDPAFAGALVFDEFAQEILVTRALPWEPATTTLPRAWGDADDVRCAEWLQRHEINVPPVVVGRSVVAVARNIRIHPVQDYLRALAWDGTLRLDAWAVTYLGAADTALNRAMASLWMISAVATPPAPIGFVGDGLTQPIVGDVGDMQRDHAVPMPCGGAHGVHLAVVGGAARAAVEAGAWQKGCTVQAHARPPVDPTQTFRI